jgi:hypothetical protein
VVPNGFTQKLWRNTNTIKNTKAADTFLHRKLKTLNNPDSHPPNTNGDNSSVDNFLPVRSKYFQHVTASYNENGDDCHTEHESKIDTRIEDIILQKFLSFIESAKGHQIAVSTVMTCVWNASEQIQNYLGDKLTTRENRRIRELYLRIIRHPNIEVVKHKPQLIVRWSNGELPSETLDLEFNSA